MASNITKPAETAAVKDTKAAAVSVYSAAELANNHKLFGVNREIVVIALRKAGKKNASFAEAKTIIDKFKAKEVK